MGTSTRHRTKYIPHRLVTTLLYGDLGPDGSRIVDQAGTYVRVPRAWLRDHLNIKAGRLDEYLVWTTMTIGATIIAKDPKDVLIHLPPPGDWRTPTR